MTSNKPYLIRAMYEWMCDNAVTPYVYIDTRCSDIGLPDNLRVENPLVLNISPAACVNLVLDNAAITFQARFSGRVFDVFLPIDSIMAILAKETGEGLQFPAVAAEAGVSSDSLASDPQTFDSQASNPQVSDSLDAVDGALGAEYNQKNSHQDGRQMKPAAKARSSKRGEPKRNESKPNESKRNEPRRSSLKIIK
ncbi:stringent starvation protein B [Ostreibacterium oceani]|uniref:Stringent starvation protein B n=1 Tax=Ostreibacterium oceani TaxID=2654998 RepID=A0A6N7EZA5_9GAMM|nr:ClpXP protease specificity-enhancing factor SspB [Ostreibacterium oceani]MPV86699.1 hypothetical protein [Ostreibacterium oceani]